MRHPTDDEIMRALCCGAECAVGPKNTGYCHRWDFTSEAARIRALLDRHGAAQTVQLLRDIAEIGRLLGRLRVAANFS